MIPILYAKNATDFTGNGIGHLKDTIKSEVTEERNGSYELTLQYPITGAWYSNIADGVIIKAKANETSDLQLFRVYKTSKPINGIITYSAEHISYDLNGIPSLGLSIDNATAQMAINKALTEAALSHNFAAWSDISTLNGTTISIPCSVRALFGGQRGSVLDVWGGEYEFDNFVVKLHAHRGSDTGIIIEYGKNLKDIKQESNIAECYTHLMPYAKKTVKTTDESGTTSSHEEIIALSEKVLPLSTAEDIGHYRAYIMDFSSKFDAGATITEETLRALATAYAADCEIGIPKVNITASFVQLWQTEEYKNIAPLERVKLCDKVTVRFAALGVSATAKIIKTVYDSLGEKYNSVELGDAKSNFANSVAKQNTAINTLAETVKKGFAAASVELANAILTATNLITGQSGGYVVLNPAESPQEILILDAPTISAAVNVWRWNSGGLGFSNTGYNGEYALAITMDGAIVADFITAGTLNGALLRADSIQAAAISQHFKTEITTEINSAAGVVEQAFVAADEQLLSVITSVNNVLSGDLETTTETISQLQQSLNSLVLSFTTQYTGGVNNVLNSSGLNGVSDEWNYTGSVSALQTDEAINNTISGSLFALSAAIFWQEIKMIAGAIYTLTFKTKRTSDSRGYVLINNGGNDTYVYDYYAAEEWTEYALTFTAASNLITLLIATTGQHLYIADIMLTYGDIKARWSPAPNEIYTTNIKIDRKGINITNTESATETIIDNTQFAVKHKGAIVLTVNKDLTTLKKTEITDELTIGKGKFIPKSNGVDFALLD